MKSFRLIVQSLDLICVIGTVESYLRFRVKTPINECSEFQYQLFLK